MRWPLLLKKIYCPKKLFWASTPAYFTLMKIIKKKFCIKIPE